MALYTWTDVLNYTREKDRLIYLGNSTGSNWCLIEMIEYLVKRELKHAFYDMFCVRKVVGFASGM